MTDEELQAIRERCAKATPGPWSAWYEHDDAKGITSLDINTPEAATGGYVFRMNDEHILHCVPVPNPEDYPPLTWVAPDNGVYIASHRQINRGYDLGSGDPIDDELVPLKPHDAAFIAHAREDVPALLAEVDRLRKCRDWINSSFGEGFVEKVVLPAAQVPRLDQLQLRRGIRGEGRLAAQSGE